MAEPITVPLATAEDDTRRTRWPEHAPQAPAPQEGGAITVPLATKESTPGYVEDMAKSGATQAVFGAADIPTMPGSLGHLLGEGISAAGDAALGFADKLGILPGEHTPETLPKAVSNWWEGLASEDAKKYAAKYGSRADLGVTDWPTSEEAEKALRKAVPALDYTPQTKPGEYFGSASRMGVSALAGGPGRTAAEKVFAGAVGGLGSELAGDTAKGMGLGDYEAPARFLGAILGTGVGTRTAGSLRAFTGANAEAEQRVLAALQEDKQNGKLRMTPEQIKEAYDAGLEPTVYDIGGPATRKMLAKMGGMAPEELDKFNANLTSRNNAARTHAKDFVTNEFGLANRAGDEQLAMKLANKRQTDVLYDLARNNPAANFVTSPRIEELTKYEPVKQAMARVAKLAEDPQFGIRPPQAAPNFGGPQMAPTPGNLAFWDHVKRDLDAQIKSLKKDGDPHYVTTWKNELLDELDKQVKGYDIARAKARQGFQAETAIEAGTEFATQPNTFKTAELKKTIAAYTPEERELFIKGVGDTLMVKAQESPRAFSAFVAKPENAERLRAALGDARYDRLYGYAQSSELLHNAATVAGIAPLPSRLAGHTGLLAGVAAAASEMGYVAALPPGVAAKVIAGVAFDTASKELKYAAEKRIAPRVVQLAQSSDPADLTRLGQLLQSNPAANAFYTRVSNTLAQLGQLGLMGARSQAGMQEVPRAQRKAGGRIGRTDHMAIAASLIRAAEKAKKGHGSSTEPLLSQPDEAITKALAIANEAI